MKERVTLWKQNAAYLQEFLALTEHIEECLNTIENIDEAYPQMARDVEKRGLLIPQISEVTDKLDTLQGGEMTEEEKKQEWLCHELLKQIDEIEKKNKRKMEDAIEQYKGKMRSNKQSRETLGAYNNTQMYETEGTILNKLR